MLTRTSTASFHLLSIPYRKRKKPTNGLTYSTAVELKESNISSKITSHVSLSVEENGSPHVRHTFPKGLEWAPEKIEINGRKGRRIICVLAKDKVNYRIYDIDSGREQGEILAEDEA